MIINCPQCSARFLVADAKIPSEGRTVRCGNCAHQWHVTLPETHVKQQTASSTEPAPDITEFETMFQEAGPLEPGTNVPALRRRSLSVRPFKIAAPVLAAIWLALAFFTYFPSWVEKPGLKNIYQIFGVSSTQGLTFSNVKMERAVGETKTKFLFSGTIVNHAAVVRTLPNVYVSLKDKKGAVIWGRTYPVNMTLKAGEVYPFRIVNVETSFADSVATIVLDLGHSLELMMR